MIATNVDYTKIVNAFIASDGVQKAFNIRPCNYVRSIPLNAFSLFEYPEKGTLDIILKPEAKALWFLNWCSENGKVGSIEIQTDKIDQQGDYVLVVCSTKIYVDGVVIATDVGSRAAYWPTPNGYDADRAADMDRAVQQAASYSKGRALSNAGFGACCSCYNTPCSPYSSDAGSDQPAIFNGNQEDIPFVMSGSDAGPAGPVTFAADANASPAGNPSFIENGRSEALQSQVTPQQDLVAEAKAKVWPYSGVYKGMKLGEILATSPAQIIWIASNRCRYQEFREAAKLLLPEANRLCGKA